VARGRDAAEVERVVAATGVPVTRLRASFEDLFLALVGRAGGA